MRESDILKGAKRMTCVISVVLAFGSTSGQPATLAVERQDSHHQVVFVLNQAVNYKTADSKKFVTGHLKEITDSSASFENKDLQIVRVLHRELIAFRLQRTNLIVDLRKPLTNYNSEKVVVKLKSGKRISGKLISMKGDSLAIQMGYKKKLVSASYSEIESVGMHKRGSGGLGVLVGGIGGGLIGAIIGVGSRPATNTSVYSDDFGVGVSAIGGFLIGVPIGAAFGSSNKLHQIDGNQEKFHLLVEKINKRLWVLRAHE